MAVTEDLVREELKKVIDPELFVNIVDLGLVYVVTISSAPTDAADVQAAALEPAACESQPAEPATAELVSADTSSAGPEPADGAVDGEGPVDICLEMTMTSPACPAGPQLIANSKQVLERLPGVRAVEVRIVMDPPWTPDRMTDDARDQLGIF